MYYNEMTENNMTYSIDMIRLKTYITYATFSEIEFRFKTVWVHYLKKNYTALNIIDFHYNYVVETEEGNSFWFGFLHNTDVKSQTDNAIYNFTIEFNPNKLKDNKIIQYILSLSNKWFVRGFDLAIDLKVNILDLIYNQGNKRNVVVQSYGYDNKTINIRKRGRACKNIQ